MKDKLFEEMAYNILEDYTHAYSVADKDVLTRYLRTKFEEYHKQNEWISVKKRMPEKGQPILVYRPEGDMKFKAMPYTDYYWERWNTDWERWNTDKERKNLITHWMPLPEAPKKGGE